MYPENENVCRTAMLIDFCILINFRDLSPDLFNYELRTHAVSSKDNSFLGEFELFAARLTDTRDQSVKTQHFVYWSGLTWQVKLILEF